MKEKYTKDNIVAEFRKIFPKIDELLTEDYFEFPYHFYGPFMREYFFPEVVEKNNLEESKKMFHFLNDAIENGDEYVVTLVATGFFEDLVQYDQCINLAKDHLSAKGINLLKETLKITGVRREL